MTYAQHTLRGSFSRRLASLLLLGMFSILTALTPAAAKEGSDDAWGVVVKPQKAEEIVRKFDENGDGKIDRTEFSLRIVRFFNDLDRNRDDFVTRDEIPGLSKSAFDAIDANKDGKISAYEFVTADSLKFEAIDTDNDGFITVEEVAAYGARGRS